MALDYTKENSMRSLSEFAASTLEKKTQQKRLSGKKLASILVGISVFLIFAGGYCLDMSPAAVVDRYMNPNALVVSGIICNERCQSAIIFDEIYHVGDTVKGFTITRIDADGVEFVKGRKTVFKEVNAF